MNYIERTLVPYRSTRILWNCIFTMKLGEFTEYSTVWFHRSGEASVIQKTVHMDMTRGRTK